MLSNQVIIRTDMCPLQGDIDSGWSDAYLVDCWRVQQTEL